MEFQLQHQSFCEYSGLISFRMNWLDLLAVQGTLKSLLQHHSSKASILWHSTFLYSPTLTSIHDYWKNNSFDQTDFVSKVMSPLFNMLSRLVITFLPRSRNLIISWLQSRSALIFYHYPGRGSKTLFLLLQRVQKFNFLHVLSKPTNRENQNDTLAFLEG